MEIDCLAVVAADLLTCYGWETVFTICANTNQKQYEIVWQESYNVWDRHPRRYYM